jgi:hypothetical protein
VSGAWPAFVLWLLLASALQWIFARAGKVRAAVSVAAALGVAAIMVLVPWGGHWLPFWTGGLAGTFSVPLAAILMVGLAGRTVGRPLFRSSEWTAAWGFGVVASVLLYPRALGFGPRNFDAYSLGWPWLIPSQSFVLIMAVAVAAAVLIWRGNRFGFVLLLTLAAYPTGLQESANFWDYVQDPVYGILSMLVLLGWLAGRLMPTARRFRTFRGASEGWDDPPDRPPPVERTTGPVVPTRKSKSDCVGLLVSAGVPPAPEMVTTD